MDLPQLRAQPAARAVLEERARTLSQTNGADGLQAGEPLLTFLLGSSSYSLPAASVHEVRPLSACTPLPRVPPQIVGLVNVRGRLMVALDIRPLLAMPASPPAPDSMLIIIATGEVEVGLLADQITAVRLASFTLAPPPSSGHGQSTPWLRGVDEALSLHLDPTALIADSRLAITEEG
jgi:purine-binding chemotaxis protein CheW